jgi:hypothetical protein
VPRRHAPFGPPAEQADQDRNDGNDHQQLDQRERPPAEGGGEDWIMRTSALGQNL